jgi:branched-chain amino acid transport system substrate-binding protein
MSNSIRDRGGKLVRPLAVLITLAFVAAACGDDDDNATATTAATPATTEAAPATTEAAPATTEAAPATTEASTATTEAAPGTTAAASGEASGPATGDPVKIVFLGDETGVVGFPIGDLIKASADAINAKGGLNGHPIEISVTDIKSDVAAAQAAVAAIPDDTIAVLLNSPISEASIADSLSALGIPILGVGYNPSVWGGNLEIFKITCATSPDNCANENFLTTASTIETTIGDQLLGAVNVGATKVTTASCAEVDSCSAAEPIFTAIGQSLGLEVVPAVKISSTASDYSAECIGFIQQGIDFVQISASAGAAVNLINSCIDQGYEGSFGASAGSVRAEILATKAQVAGGLNGFPWFVDDPKVVEYRDIMDGAGIDELTYGYPVSTGMYANLLLLQKAINAFADPSAPLDGAAALAAMYQVKDETLDGLLATPVTFSPDDLDRTNNCFWPYISAADGSISNPEGGLNTQCYPES